MTAASTSPDAFEECWADQAASHARCPAVLFTDHPNLPEMRCSCPCHAIESVPGAR